MRLTDALAARQGQAAPTYLGLRFDARGQALPDPGCTVVAHVREPAANAALATVRATMEAAGLARFWAWLPPSSFHMTMFDMLLHSRRGAAWPTPTARSPRSRCGREFFPSCGQRGPLTRLTNC